MGEQGGMQAVRLWQGKRPKVALAAAVLQLQLRCCCCSDLEATSVRLGVQCQRLLYCGRRWQVARTITHTRTHTHTLYLPPPARPVSVARPLHLFEVASSGLFPLFACFACPALGRVSFNICTCKRVSLSLLLSLSLFLAVWHATKSGTKAK